MSQYSGSSTKLPQFEDVELPPRPDKSIQRFQVEREQDAWYWRALASLAALLIMVGFLIFPGAFPIDDGDSNNNTQNEQRTIPITIGALVVINCGFILSVVLWFLRKNWLYQLDCLFVPCLTSSVFGLANSLIVPNLVLRAHGMSASVLAAIIVSAISSGIYGLLTLLTWKRLDKLRKAPLRPNSQQRVWQSDEELQRTQWQHLYQTPGEGITPAQFQSHRTYHIEPVLPKTKAVEAHELGYGYGGAYNTI